MSRYGSREGCRREDRPEPRELIAYETARDYLEDYRDAFDDALQLPEILRCVDLREHVDRWLAAWNSRDLDAIMDCYAEDVDFVAPTVVSRWSRSDGRLHGAAELRQHFQKGLELAPDLRFSEEALMTTPGGYALFYRRENDNRALDAVELDATGRAKRVRAYYEQHQA